MLTTAASPKLSNQSFHRGWRWSYTLPQKPAKRLPTKDMVMKFRDSTVPEWKNSSDRCVFFFCIANFFSVCKPLTIFRLMILSLVRVCIGGGDTKGGVGGAVISLVGLWHVGAKSVGVYCLWWQLVPERNENSQNRVRNVVVRYCCYGSSERLLSLSLSL